MSTITTTTVDLAAVSHNTDLRQALEYILQPTTSTTEKIVRCSALQEDLQDKIASLTQHLHKVSAECAERASRIPQQLDTHVAWVKQARGRAGNVRKSLDATKERLQRVLASLERLAANEEDHAKRTEAQMNSIVSAIEKNQQTQHQAPAPAIATSNASITSTTAPPPSAKKEEAAEKEESKENVAAEEGKKEE